MIKKEILFFSLFLIFFSAMAISLLHDNGLASITGRASSATATTSVNLEEETSIKVMGSVDFGTGRVYANATGAVLDSSVTGADAVINGTWNFSSMPQYILIENDGTVNISVNLSAEGNKNANGLIGGTSPSFQMKGIATEANSCVTLQTAYTNVPNSTETPLNICDILKFPQNSDSFNVSAKLVIPNDAITGQRNVTLTFSASKV